MKLLFMVPTTLKDEILAGCHDCPTSGHLGIQKTLDGLNVLLCA